eukprot:6974254-Pyramimonas_sp.AAC.1
MSSSGSLVNSIVTSPKSGAISPELVPSVGATTWIQHDHPSDLLSGEFPLRTKSEDDANINMSMPSTTDVDEVRPNVSQLQPASTTLKP